MKIKRLLVINVPIKNCNLKCGYCYISALKKRKRGPAVFQYSPEHVAKCLSKKRLGGTCIINLTGAGETLIPKEMPQYIYQLLLQGHYLEVVTNATLTDRFIEISKFPRELLNHLEFKCSFHYKELERKGWIDRFFDNIRMVKEAGCSFTVELMPDDKLISEINNIIALCKRKVGAPCHITVGRNDLTKNKEILTKLDRYIYEDIWKKFDSDMFKFKLEIFDRKIKKFCYAGMWSLYIDLGTGDTKPCYGQMKNQNIFENPAKPIKFAPVGTHCRQPYCYNGHAFLSLGMVPEMDTPCYADIRNRKLPNGEEWLSPDVKAAFSKKLVYSNHEWTKLKKFVYNCSYPLRFVKTAVYDRKEICEKVFKIK